MFDNFQICSCICKWRRASYMKTNKSHQLLRTLRMLHALLAWSWSVSVVKVAPLKTFPCIPGDGRWTTSGIGAAYLAWSPTVLQVTSNAGNSQTDSRLCTQIELHNICGPQQRCSSPFPTTSTTGLGFQSVDSAWYDSKFIILHAFWVRRVT